MFHFRWTNCGVSHGAEDYICKWVYSSNVFNVRILFKKTYINISFLIFLDPDPLQNRSSNCTCFLSCDGAPEHLKKLKIVDVLVEFQSVTVHEGNYTISSVFREDGHCAVAVPECSHLDSQYVLIIYKKNKTNENQLYSTTAKPGRFIIDLSNVLMN